MDTFNSILAFTRHFDSDEKCWDYMERLKWEGKPACPHCESGNPYKLKGRMYKCSNGNCYKKFNVISTTFFENTKLPMQKWFIAIWLVTCQKRGVSSVQLAKHIDCTQKTAWFMIHRIREAFGNDRNTMFDGVIEVDETYVGGKERFKHYNKKTKGQQGRGAGVKTNVFGMLQRNGKVRSMKVANVGTMDLQPIIVDNVREGSTIMSDEWKAYWGLETWYVHKSTDHGKRQYVDGDITTNTLEGYWSHFKRLNPSAVKNQYEPEASRYLAQGIKREQCK